MTARRVPFGTLLAREEEDIPPTRRSRRDWVADTVIFVLAALLGTASLISSFRYGLHGALLVIDAITGALLCVALWWRRRWPFALGLASLPVLAISSSGGPAGIFILFTVAAYRRWQLAFLVAAAQLALLPAERAVHPQGGSTTTYYLTGFFGTAVVVAWAMFWRGRRQTQRERHRRAAAEEQLRVEQIRHAERARIAREMHDVLAHRISLLSLHAGALEYRPDASTEEIARAAAVIRASAHQALEDLRAVIGLLRDGSDGAAAAAADARRAAGPAGGVTGSRDAAERRRAAGRPGRRPRGGRPPRPADSSGGADQRPQACGTDPGRSVHRGSARPRADDRGAQPGTGPRRRRRTDSRVRNRARRPDRARHPLRRPA
jgi:hypothetical protein